MADVLDYQIFGNDLQLVEVELDPGEGVRAEVGTMTYMITIHSLTFSIIAFISGIGPRRRGSMELVTWTGVSKRFPTPVNLRTLP